MVVHLRVLPLGSDRCVAADQNPAHLEANFFFFFFKFARLVLCSACALGRGGEGQ